MTRIIGKTELTKYDKMDFEIDVANIIGEGESIQAANDKLIRSDDVDVSTTSLSGTLTISGTKIITRTVEALDENKTYQLQVIITVNGRTYCYIVEIRCLEIYG